MPAPQPAPPDACDLESVIATARLVTRPRRALDAALETEILLKLNRALAADPETFFQKLVEAALQLSQADSIGISLLNQEAGRFIWPAVAGPFHAYLWEGTPSNFGPCGTVLERDATQLMLHPERHFTYLQPIQPGLEEVLLVPFYLEGKAVGTIWAVIHEAGRHFDGEDQRLLESLSAFAASAYRTLFKAGSLAPFLQKKTG
jgi:GAF domain-containing protein